LSGKGPGRWVEYMKGWGFRKLSSKVRNKEH